MRKKEDGLVQMATLILSNVLYPEPEVDLSSPQPAHMAAPPLSVSCHLPPSFILSIPLFPLPV